MHSQFRTLVWEKAGCTHSVQHDVAHSQRECTIHVECITANAREKYSSAFFRGRGRQIGRNFVVRPLFTESFPIIGDISAVDLQRVRQTQIRVRSRLHRSLERTSVTHAVVATLNAVVHYTSDTM